MDGSIIVGDRKLVAYDQRVRTWHDSGLTFDLKHAPRRQQDPRLIVLHWTASERPDNAGAARLHESLRARGLSVEFAITNDGTIHQFVDPVIQRGRHCSRLNPYSIGVEVSGLGWAAKPGRVPRGDTTKRDVYTDRVHGWRTEFYDYLPSQHNAVRELCELLWIAYPALPRAVCLEPFERWSTETLLARGGVCGHLHGAWLTKKHPKCDPGTAPLRRLAEHVEATRDHVPPVR